MTIARYILQDEDIRRNLDEFELPNEITLAAFREDNATMPVFQTIDELRQDLLT